MDKHELLQELYKDESHNFLEVAIDNENQECLWCTLRTNKPSKQIPTEIFFELINHELIRYMHGCYCLYSNTIIEKTYYISTNGKLLAQKLAQKLLEEDPRRQRTKIPTDVWIKMTELEREYHGRQTT